MIVEPFDVQGNHREVGLAIGRQTAESVHSLFDEYQFLQEDLLPFYRTSVGHGYYQAFLKLHQEQFPEYISELEGIAEGANRSFIELFLVNLRGEFRGLIRNLSPDDNEREEDVKSCTDCMILSPEMALIGHNEDGTPAALGKLFLVSITVDNNRRFTALCYPGFLPGNACCHNEAGILHTINALNPLDVTVGFGRNFLARSLLEAGSIEDAVKRVTVPGRAAGFNYNIGSISERRLISLEVSPERHAIHEVNGVYFHTNHYLEIPAIDQEISTSSTVRLERALNLYESSSSMDTTRVLEILGDQEDRDFPIFRDASPPDPAATLCTTLFDLDDRKFHVFWGHPLGETEKTIRSLGD
ncbi:MAG: hypothetical protein GTO18_21455 [Anaerolineales bacterium]|nr:hypothetical protein [Anaerolineales bacterium]